MRIRTVTALAWLIGAALVSAAAGLLPETPLYGPANGSLVICGGGRLPSEIIEEFITRAGGPDAPIVVVPTAGGAARYDASNGGLRLFTEAGATDVTLLHTYDPEVADTDSFAAPLERARGVWFVGGRQWRLVDAYAGTRTLEGFWSVLDRGGVIGGSSAGASIQASYMVRGAPEGNRIMMAEGHEQGFGFLRNAAVDQHIDTRGREADLLEVLAAYPELLGVGLYEGTAIVVDRDLATVLGRGKAAFYDARDRGDPATPYTWLLDPGEVFDLRARRPMKP